MSEGVKAGSAKTTAACRWLLGGVLLTAGLSKLGTTHELAKLLANYRLLPISWNFPLAMVVPPLEMMLGLCLVLGVMVRAASTGSVGLTLAFTGFVGSALARGLNVECGCFSGAVRVSWGHLLVNLALLALALGALLGPPDPWVWETRLSRLQRAKAVLLLSLLPVLGSAIRIGAGNPPDNALAAPTVIFEPEHLDLGSVPEGELVRRSVRFVNTGSRQLWVTWVQTSCGCTVAQPRSRRLDPGTSGELTIEYQPGSAGEPIRQTVKLYQQGVVEPAVLEVAGQVVPASVSSRDL